MSSSQRFCLRWNNHQSNLLSVFEQLLQDESFVDVTLAVEGLYLKAHKMVLSACSPYFQTLFVNNPDKHPIVFLKDVPYSDMRSLLDFMYKGEVSVDQERLTAFLKVAESLRIKGLTEVNEEKCDLPSITSSLLASNAGGSGDEGRHMSHHLMGHKRQSSSPSPMHHLQHHSSMATYPPKRKRGRPRKLSGSELEASSLVGVVVGGEPAHNNNNNNHHHLSDIDLPSEKGESGCLVLQGPPELLETRVDHPHLGKERHMSPHRGSPAGSHAHHDRASASRSPDDHLATHKDPLSGRKVKEEPEPTPGPSSHDPSHGYSRTSNSQDSDGGGGGSGGSVAGGSYSTESRALDLKTEEAQHSKHGQSGSPLSVGGDSTWGSSSKDIKVKHNESGAEASSCALGSLAPPPPPLTKPPMRRRARRRASSTHESAEQLTEMSVRGLNLFRYASVSEGVYKCIECEKANMVKTFKNKYSFQRHAFLYHEGHQRKVFPCPVCGKEFSRPDKMKNHMKTVHDCFMPKDCIVPLGFFLQP